MMFMEVHYEDGDKDPIVYGDQGVSTEEHNKATYSELTKLQKMLQKTLPKAPWLIAKRMSHTTLTIV